MTGVQTCALPICVTNQFEQQVRVMTGLPLGNPSLHSDAVMVNILGDSWFAGAKTTALEPAWNKALSHANLKLHLYGKHEPRKGRKMGHFTVIDNDLKTALNAALIARCELHIGE